MKFCFTVAAARLQIHSSGNDEYLVTVKYHFVRWQRPLSTTKFVQNTRHLGLPTHIEGPSAQAKGSYIEI